MTRKDFELIAEVLKSARLLALVRTQPQYASGELALKTAAEFMASALAKTNPRFDRERFLEACGVSS